MYSEPLAWKTTVRPSGDVVAPVIMRAVIVSGCGSTGNSAAAVIVCSTSASNGITSEEPSAVLILRILPSAHSTTCSLSGIQLKFGYVPKIAHTSCWSNDSLSKTGEAMPDSKS